MALKDGQEILRLYFVCVVMWEFPEFFSWLLQFFSCAPFPDLKLVDFLV